MRRKNDILDDGKKIYQDPHVLSSRLEELRAKGARIIFANGCFELLHVGHVRYLKGAKALGDVLICAINTDESLKIIKPDRKPVNPDVERFEIVAALESVDFVVPLRERTPAELLAILKPDVHTKGTDYTLDMIPERSVVQAYGGQVAIVGDDKSHSTTQMINEIRGPILS